MMNSKHFILLPILLIGLFAGELRAQSTTNLYQNRIALEAGFSPFKKVKLSISPELRLSEDLTLAKGLLETKLRYKAGKNIFFYGIYRLGINPRENKTTLYENRYSLAAAYKFKINAFRPSFRLAYTNDSDDLSSQDSENKNYLRLKTALQYKIPQSRFTPEIGLEYFYDLGSSNSLKMRYKAGVEYKLFRNNSIGLNYKLDYFLQEYTNKHIFSLNYQLKF